jgi:hypothetical protein
MRKQPQFTRKPPNMKFVCNLLMRIYRPILFVRRKLTCRILGSHNGGYEEYYLLRYNAV